MIQMRVVVFGMLIAVSAVAEGQSQQAAGKPLGKSFFVDFAENSVIKYQCDVDPSFMRCIGVDPTQNHDKCVAIFRKVAPDCKQRLLSSMPDTVSGRDEIKRYSNEFTDCAMTNAMTSQGKSFEEVNTCMAGAQGQAPGGASGGAGQGAQSGASPGSPSSAAPAGR